MEHLVVDVCVTGTGPEVGTQSTVELTLALHEPAARGIRAVASWLSTLAGLNTRPETEIDAESSLAHDVGVLAALLQGGPTDPALGQLQPLREQAGQGWAVGWVHSASGQTTIHCVSVAGALTLE